MLRGAVRSESALLRDLDEIFAAHDTTRSGSLSPHQYRLAHLEAFGAPPSDRDMPSGPTHRDVFFATMRRKAPLWDAEDRARVVFGAFDVDRKGYLTREDFAAACGVVAPHLSASTVDNAYGALDEHGDGRVRFNTFKARLDIE